MIKLVVFDLDGVLIDSKDVHHNALNKAIESVLGISYVISKADHLAHYDGMGTKRKLHIFCAKHRGVSVEKAAEIYRLKQLYTATELQQITPNNTLIDLFSDLKGRGFKTAVATNAIRQTLDLSLINLGLVGYVDRSYSNEDVWKQKPAAEIYLKACIDAGVNPDETLVVEDSPVGRQAAISAGCHLLPVTDTHSWSKEDVFRAITKVSLGGRSKPWAGTKVNVVIPMAGAGSRFEKAGYTFPKPLIEVRGKPMIQVVVENLGITANFIFICQKAHVEKYNLKTMLNLIAPGCKIVEIDGMTEGAACTVLKASEFIRNEDPLIIANSDQFLEWNPAEFYYSMEADKGIHGGIVTFKATHPKWSFAKVIDGYITEVAEKNPISDDATVGVYYWKAGIDFCLSAEIMIKNNRRVNGEFYVAPVFNEAIRHGRKFKPYQIDKMWGIGTPEDLNYFLENYKGAV